MASTIRKRTNQSTGTPLESSIVKGILKYLNSLPGCRAIKTHGGHFTSGEPDIDAVYHGLSLKLEVKRPRRKATPLQLKTLDGWREAGAITGVVTSVDQVKEIINQLAGVKDRMAY